MLVHVVHLNDASRSIMLDEMALPLKQYSDRELTLKAIELTSRKAAAAQRELTGAPLDGAELEQEAGLANPIVTDANLRHYLELATRYQGETEVPASGERRSRLLTFLVRLRYQARYNAAIVNAIHQLDHRTQLQQRTMARLEAELADARRALAAIEAERGASS
jgi:hypothetical protein